MKSTRLLTVVLLWLIPAVTFAEVAKVSIASRSTVAGGQAFGPVGAYEKLTGTVEFALDPNEPHNKRIVDIQYAPRAADGRVHFTSDLYVLRPVDQAKGNGVLLFEVANRGNKLLFGHFNGVRGSNDPTSVADFGDGFLMREGYTIVWVGWQFDVAPPLLHVDAPAVDTRMSPTPDVARFSFILDAPATEAAPRDLPQYLPKDASDPSATLTVRNKFWETPKPLPRAAWRIVATAARPRVVLDSGFEPGRVYEITYHAQGTQHGEAPFPPSAGGGQQLPNPTPQVAVMHALLRAAHAWMTAGTMPPESRYPRLGDRTAVLASATGFPRIPGVGDPATIEGPGEMRNGRFAALPFLVPRIDADGNDAAGIRVPDLAVPLATTTGWNFRSPKVGNPGTIYALLGSYVLFAFTKAQREVLHDPRLSVAERYAGKDGYLQKVRAAADALIAGRYLLPEDVDGVLARANAHWEYSAQSGAGSSARR